MALETPRKKNKKSTKSHKSDKNVFVKFTALEEMTDVTRPSSTYSSASTDSASSSKSVGTKIQSSLDPSNDSEEEEREFEAWKKRRSVLSDIGGSHCVAVTIQSGSFTWDSKKKLPILENITTSIPSGRLTIVVGNVGSGKTSLLQALIGEMITLKGQLKWNGEMSVAYISQHPWLLNATLRDNILFGRRLLARRYQRVLQACALKPDIDILPNGDQTEIGERGFNLSGGQRQRVAVARALYSDARTVIMVRKDGDYFFYNAK
ncbi:hypothetical protein SK128_015540 [Halocaridina rubra]|uniref:ABC transporter domain-containing protein n=1 Tax=Halocaridina rubra TaxID=373956 RepID=A0AAN8X5M1_HALRR